MNLFSTHSFLVVRPQPDIAAHRGPLSPEALRLWLKGLSTSGTTLTTEEAGFRLSWSHPHSPFSEANQIDCIRVNVEALAALLKMKPLPCPTSESGSYSFFFYSIIVCRCQKVGLSLFFQRGVASTPTTALCRNRAGAKSARYRNHEQETISLEEDTPCYHSWWVTKELDAMRAERPTFTLSQWARMVA